MTLYDALMLAFTLLLLGLVFLPLLYYSVQVGDAQRKEQEKGKGFPSDGSERYDA